MKSEKLQRILNRFDGAALLTLRKSSPEELDLLVAWSIKHKLGAWGGVPAPRPQSNSEGRVNEEKQDPMTLIQKL